MSFQSIYPQPFRFLSLLQLSLLSSAIILKFYHQQQHSLYYLSLSLTITILIAIISNQLIINHLLPTTTTTTTTTFQQQLLPIILSIPSFTILILPPTRLTPFSTHFRLFHRKLLPTITRIFSFNSNQLTKFSDLIITDLLTSLARPIADLIHLFTLILNLNLKLQTIISISFNCLPYLLRFKQCINDLILLPPNHQLRSALNAIKYSTAIPPIILQQTQRLNDYQNNSSSTIIIYLINSIYSTYWDTVNDWGFSSTQLISYYHHHQQQQPHNLAKIDLEGSNFNPSTPQRILFSQDQAPIYLLLILINLILRHTWLLSLLTTTHGPRISFCLQASEVLRRALWLLLRLEWADLSTHHSPKHPSTYALLDLSHNKHNHGTLDDEQEEDGDEEGDEEEEEEEEDLAFHHLSPHLTLLSDLPTSSTEPPTHNTLHINPDPGPSSGLPNSSFFHRPIPTTSSSSSSPTTSLLPKLIPHPNHPGS